MTNNVAINNAMENVTCTVTVTGTKTFSVRCWIGLRIMFIAALVLPFKTDVELKHD